MHRLFRVLSRPPRALLLAALIASAVGCGTLRSQGDTACDRDGDCQSQLGDPPADASWRCVEHQCSALAAGPFEAEEPGPVEARRDETAEAEPDAPPVGPNARDVECTRAVDCMVLGPMPADATWVCVEGRCGLQGAGPFHADDLEPE